MMTDKPKPGTYGYATVHGVREFGYIDADYEFGFLGASFYVQHAPNFADFAPAAVAADPKPCMPQPGHHGWMDVDGRREYGFVTGPGGTGAETLSVFHFVDDTGQPNAYSITNELARTWKHDTERGDR